MLSVEKADLKEFIAFPFKLYKDDKFYVPELKADTKHLLTKDPFWRHAGRELFLAKRNGQTVGRIAAIVNENHNKHWNDNIGFFGFFECENNQETAKALFDAAAAWLKEQGKTAMRGPVNPGTNHTCGVLIDSFDSMPCIMMPYNPPYYDGLIKSAGFEKAKDLLAFDRTDKNSFSPRMEKIIQRILRNPELTIRSINMNDFDNEVKTVREIYNAAWSQNYGFVPITEEEIKETAKQLKLIVRPELTCMIEIKGEPAGFAISIPNMNHVLKILNGGLNPFKLPKALLAWRKIRDCRMIMLGVHPDHRSRGLELLLVKHVVDNGVSKGWNKAELSWMLEDNKAIISVIEEAGCYKTKTYRIYQKSL